MGGPVGTTEQVPHDLASEHALLGAVLINGDALDRARDHVRPDDFAEPINGHIFRVMCERRDAGEPIDIGLMRAVLGNADLGGITVGAYIARLAAEATTVVNAPGYARLIAQAARMRIVFDAGRAAVAAMKRADKRPQLMDLRESGSIEQDADDRAGTKPSGGAS